MSMHAAVVRSFDHPPRYETCDTPNPGPTQTLVEVLAAALHPRVRTGASGKHYTSSRSLPMIPGIDGVGRLPNGRHVFFVAADDVRGSMADRAIVVECRTVPLPDNVDVTRVAAAMNPAMSSWVALRRRVPIQQGQSVLVLGATGNAGAMAIQVAKHLGAHRVIGAGRDPERLARLAEIGADGLVALVDDPTTTAKQLADAASDVDIVIDYLWGEPATTAIVAILESRTDRTRALNWIQIGAMAGPTIQLPSVALRSANFRLQGSGQGSVSLEVYLSELPSLVDEIASGTFTINVNQVSLADVEAIWSAPEDAGQRTVFIP